jgi:HEAT repeat protein
MDSLDPNERARGLVDALADPQARDAALREIASLGGSARAALHAGLRDGRAEVRRWCTIALWQQPAPDDLPALLPLLRDPRSTVRHAAVVALALAHPPAEVVPRLVERALEDPSLRVRRQAVSMLAWRLAHPDLEGFFTGLLEHERDEKLLRHARAGLRACRSASC